MIIDENNDYFVQKVQIDAKDDAPRFSNKDQLIENGTKILKQKILKLVGLFGLDVKYNLVGLSINTLNFYPKTQYMNNCQYKRTWSAASSKLTTFKIIRAPF